MTVTVTVPVAWIQKYHQLKKELHHNLVVSYPTMADAPHMFPNGYKNMLAVALETDYSYPHDDQIKEYLKDPSKFAAAAPAAAAPSGDDWAAPEEENKEESDGESEGEGMGLSLFDD